MIAEKNKKNTFNIKNFLIDNNTYLIFLFLFILSSFLSKNFFTVMNLRNIALQQAAPVFVAVGMLFVVLTGGIDLSVGSMMALGASLSAILTANLNVNIILSICITLIVGVILASFTGFLVAYANMQGFVASLAIMTIARGIAFVITNATPTRFPENTVQYLVSKSYGYPIIILTIFLIILFWFIQKYTAYGRLVIAVGSNSTAVNLAGVNVKKYIISVYALSGLLSSIAGIFVASRSATGSPTIGQGQELDAIAACVIGGASLAGGKGSVVKTLTGALVLALIRNIMNLLAVPSYPQDIIKGIIIILAVLLQTTTDSRKTDV
jgi:ribose transport system permease protein